MPPTKRHVVREETITPERAAKLLASSPGNRREKEAAVMERVADILGDQWRLSSNPIVIDTAGRLRDGHHRLRACTLAGKPITVLVAYDWPEDAIELVDTQTRRTLASVLQLRGVQYARQRAAILGTCASLAAGRHVVINEAKDVGAWEPMFSEGLEWALREFYSVPNRLHCNGAVAGAFAFARPADVTKIEAAGSQFVRGTGFSEGDPMLALQRSLSAYYIRGGRFTGYAGRQFATSRVLCALRAQVLGERPSRIVSSEAHGRQFFVAFYDAKRIGALACAVPDFAERRNVGTDALVTEILRAMARPTGVDGIRAELQRRGIVVTVAAVRSAVGRLERCGKIVRTNKGTYRA